MKFTKFFTATVTLTGCTCTGVYAQNGDGRNLGGYGTEHSGWNKNVSTSWNNYINTGWKNNSNGSDANATSSWNNSSDSVVQSEQCYSKEIVTNGDVTIRSAHNVDDQTYSIEVMYIGKGWIGFGFSKTGQMIPSKAVIGLPDSGTVSMYDLTNKTLPGVKKIEDTTLTFTKTSITQNGTHTILKFTRPMVIWSEFIVSTTSSNSYIWAVGSTNTLGLHKQSGTGSLMVYPCNQGGEQSTDTSNNVPTTGSNGNNNSTNTNNNVPVNDNVNNRDGIVQTLLDVGDGVTIGIQTNPTDRTATFEMTYEGLAWIAVAFSTNGQMIGSSAVIGLPSAGKPQKYDMATKSPSGVQLVRSTALQGTLSNTEFQQNGTHTYMKFTRPFVDSGMPDILVDGTENIFLYGYGTGNNLGIHSKRGNVRVSLAACDPTTASNCNTFTQEEGVNTRSIWLAHGICMGLAWLILIPVGVGASLLRKLLPAGGMWFTIHRGLNMTGIVLTATGFALAVIASNKEGTPHFETNLHQKIGLSIFILALGQALNGFFRPHVPSSTPVQAPKSANQRDDTANEHDDIEDAVAVNRQKTFVDNQHFDTKKSDARLIWEIGHRLFGVVMLGLAWYNCYTGINKFDTRFSDDDHTFLYWSIIGVISGCTLALGLYQHVANGRSSA